jgi:hypothetical protein
MLTKLNNLTITGVIGYYDQLWSKMAAGLAAEKLIRSLMTTKPKQYLTCLFIHFLFYLTMLSVTRNYIGFNDWTDNNKSE